MTEGPKQQLPRQPEDIAGAVNSGVNNSVDTYIQRYTTGIDRIKLLLDYYHCAGHACEEHVLVYVVSRTVVLAQQEEQQARLADLLWARSLLGSLLSHGVGVEDMVGKLLGVINSIMKNRCIRNA